MNREQARVRQSDRHIIGLDAIRFCAALMVTLFHLAYWSWAPAESLTRSVTGGIARFPSLAGVTWVGWIGVEIFFVISGFVISYSAAGATPFAFLRSRILRLYPAAWVCATATLLAVLLLGRATADTPMEYARAMTLWIQGPWIDGVYWTLGIEIVFYALIFGVLCLGRFGSIATVLSVMALASAAFWISLAVDRVLPRALPVGFVHDLLASPASAFLLLRHGCFFALGGLLWLCQSSRRITVWRAFLLGLCLLTGVLEILDSARPIVGPVGDTAAHRLIPCVVWLVAIAGLTVAIFSNQALQALFGRAAGFIKVLGLMTYPLYLVHDVIGAAIMRAACLAGLAPGVALGIAVLAVLALAWLVTQRLEPVIRTRLRIVLTGSRPPAILAGMREETPPKLMTSP